MQNWLLLMSSRASARKAVADASRVNIRARCSRPLNWREAFCVGRMTGGKFTRGKKPQSKIVNIFSHSPIFRPTAQPLVESHASSSPTRIGAPFRRPLRHSIVRFRAPTTPESRKRKMITCRSLACSCCSRCACMSRKLRARTRQVHRISENA